MIRKQRNSWTTYRFPPMKTQRTKARETTVAGRKSTGTPAQNLKIMPQRQIIGEKNQMRKMRRIGAMIKIMVMRRRIRLIMAGATIQKKTRSRVMRQTGRTSKTITPMINAKKIGEPAEMVQGQLGIRGLMKGTIDPENAVIGTREGTTANKSTSPTLTSRWSREGNLSKIRMGDSTAMN